MQQREVRVARVAAALDCGQVVNPEGALNQMEGAIVMGLGGALWEASDFEDGRLLNASFARYRVPRITDTLRMDVRLVGDADAPSTGAGEPGIVPLAAAIAGGVWAATGDEASRAAGYAPPLAADLGREGAGRRSRARRSLAAWHLRPRGRCRDSGGTSTSGTAVREVPP